MQSRIRCYNQYPGLYKNFDEMSRDLERIRGMGFDYVWVNPFYTPCQHNPIPDMESRIHSPYAMQNETISRRYAMDEKNVRQYTEEAHRLGLTPVFDLVARHVAIDHRFVTGDPEMLEKYHIDTSKWFKRHPNGNLVMHNMDENYHALTTNPWCDIATFNYDDPVVRDQVIEYFWKPFIQYNIEVLGFQAVRIDAPAMVDNEVLIRLTKIINESSQRRFHHDAVIIAETIGRGYMDENLALKGVATHVMNSVFWMPGPEGGYGYQYDLWRQDDNWFTQNKGLLQQVGPTIGFAGSHDEPRYTQQVMDNHVTGSDVLAKRMREKIATACFCSDGGWILLYGDEYGATTAVNVFDPTPIEYHKDRGLQLFDLTDYISEINFIIKKLPEPQFPEWVQRVFHDDHPDLVTFIIHQGWGYSGKSLVVTVNTDPSRQVVLNSHDIAQIMKANGRNNSTEKQQPPSAVYLCGAVNAALDLQSSQIDIISSRPVSTRSQMEFFQSRQTPSVNKEDGIHRGQKPL